MSKLGFVWWVGKCQKHFWNYLHRFSHINKEISRHFRVQWRIRHTRGESRTSRPMFPSPECPTWSSGPSPPGSWACRWWWWCRWWRRGPRRAPPPSGRVLRPRPWSRWSPCGSDWGVMMYNPEQIRADGDSSRFSSPLHQNMSTMARWWADQPPRCLGTTNETCETLNYTI